METKIWAREIPMFFQDIVEAFIEKHFKVGDEVKVLYKGDTSKKGIIERIENWVIVVGGCYLNWHIIDRISPTSITDEEIIIYRKAINKICRGMSNFSDEDIERAYKIALYEDNLSKICDKLSPILNDGISLKEQVEEFLIRNK